MTSTTTSTATTTAARTCTRTASRSARTLTLGTAGATMTLLLAGIAGAGSASAADTGIPALEAIKVCESGGDYQAQNPTSTASGAYQFLDTTWQGMDAAAGYARAIDAPEAVQDAAAIELYTEQGTTPWLASASCWQGSGVSLSNGTGPDVASAGADVGSAGESASESDHGGEARGQARGGHQGQGRTAGPTGGCSR